MLSLEEALGERNRALDRIKSFLDSVEESPENILALYGIRDWQFYLIEIEELLANEYDVVFNISAETLTKMKNIVIETKRRLNAAVN